MRFRVLYSHQSQSKSNSIAFVEVSALLNFVSQLQASRAVTLLARPTLEHLIELELVLHTWGNGVKSCSMMEA